MSERLSDKFRDLKAGPILRVAARAGISETQLRTWRASDGLKFGYVPESNPRAHPSYHLADAATVLLVVELRRRGVLIGEVTSIANAAHPYLILLSDMLLATVDGKEPGGGRVPRILTLDRHGKAEFANRDDAEFAAMINRGDYLSVCYFDLSCIVTVAFQHLCGVLNISLGKLANAQTIAPFTDSLPAYAGLREMV